MDMDSKRVCCIRLKTEFGFLYLFNVYMPCDSSSVDNCYEYNRVLSCISTFLDTNKIIHCIIG